MNPAEIRALARMLDRIDYYRLLKVDPQASLAHIRPAYRDARRRFHPDNFLGQADELRNAADLISRRITEAFLVLRDHGRRSAYDRTLAGGSMRFDAQAQEDARAQKNELRGKTAKGRRFLALAEEAERAGDLQKALTNLKMALTFERDNESFKQRIARLRERMAG